MCFWSSLVEGAKSAGGWVLDHSGDIASAVSTVAKIAGTFAAAENSDEPDNQTHLNEFHTNFKIACHELQKAAKKETKNLVNKTKRNLAPEEFDPKDAVYDSFTGIWKNPTALLADGTPAVPMYQDLSKWLSTLGVPPNQSVDVASSVAQSLFVNTGSAAANVTNGVSPDNPGDAGIQVTSFPYTDHKGQWTLDTAHAYYPIGLGTGSQDKCWHSCIYARYLPSKTQQIASKAQPTSALLSKVKSNEPVWVVNAKVNWGNASVASGVHQALLNRLNKDFNKQHRSVLSSSLNGVSQSVQIQGSASDNPSLLRQSLISTASKVVSKYTQDQDTGVPDSDLDTSGDDTSTDGGDTDDGETTSDTDAESEGDHVDDGTDFVDGFDSVAKKNSIKTDKKTKQEKKKKKDKKTKSQYVTKLASGRLASKAADDGPSSPMPMNVPEVEITQSQMVYLGAQKK